MKYIVLTFALMASLAAAVPAKAGSCFTYPTYGGGSYTVCN